MRVLITGAGGFLGRHLIEKLVEREDEVVAFDLGYKPALPPGAEPMIGSVTDPAAVRLAIEGCDALVHCAAMTGLWTRNNADYDRVNVEGTRIVLDAALEAGVPRVVHVSSFTTLIGEERGEVRNVDERLELPVGAMKGPYPRSKRQAEILCRNHPVDPVIVLPTAPIGPGDHNLTPPSRMLLDLALGKLPAMINCTWNFVDIRALADGVVDAIDVGRSGRRYILGGENMVTDDLLRMVERLTGKPAPKYRVPYGVALTAGHVEGAIAAVTKSPPKGPLTGIRLAGPRLQFSTRRAEQELGYRPTAAISAFNDALAWMKAQNLLG
ncbi:NAD-dependent epimerase/dehydratase family protein [Rhodobacteraceae bacterium NNCM2]|nr:NAD-dependent epimerase/dehydratase family protein [Coraliihabitans acroporae]